MKKIFLLGVMTLASCGQDNGPATEEGAGGVLPLGEYTFNSQFDPDKSTCVPMGNASQFNFALVDAETLVINPSQSAEPFNGLIEENSFAVAGDNPYQEGFGLSFSSSDIASGEATFTLFPSLLPWCSSVFSGTFTAIVD